MADSASGKPWYKSKTVWLNVAGAAGTLAQMYGGTVIPPQYAALVMAGANVAIRFMTSEPVTAGATPPSA